MNDIVIIGSGPAGYTAAIYCARAGLSPILVTGNLPGGLLTQTIDIENFPGFSEPISGVDLMIQMQNQAKRVGTELIYGQVTSVEFKDNGPQNIMIDGQKKIQTKAVIIATGASPRWLGLDAEKRLMAKGVSACAICDGAFFRDLPVVVVGGGDTAVEEALFLTKFASRVILIHRRDKLKASKVMAERAMSNPKIMINWDSIVLDIIGTEEVEGVKIKNIKTDKETIISCKGYFAALGHIPNTEIFTNIDKNEQGYILLKGNSSYTNIQGVFAAGDCADSVYRQAITAAGMGCRAAIDAERWLESKEATSRNKIIRAN